MDYSGKRCGDCSHWHRQPTNMANLKEVRGLCREAPPSVTTLQGQQQAGGIIQNVEMKFVAYPPVPPEFAACSRFEPRPLADEVSCAEGLRHLVGD